MRSMPSVGETQDGSASGTSGMMPRHAWRSGGARMAPPWIGKPAGRPKLRTGAGNPEETVRTQRKRILIKLGARNMTHAVALAS
jgi:hypothetical protein